MSWFFYNREGRLLYDVVAGSVGDADTLDGIDSTGFVRFGAPGLNAGNVDLDGSLTLPVVTINSDTLLNETHRTVIVDSSLSAIEVRLPEFPLVGTVYEVRDGGNNGAGNASNFNITVLRINSAHRIDGALSDLVLSADGEGRVFVFDGANWVTLASRFVPTSGAIDADTLDTLDSTQFLRSDVADTAAGSISFSEITNFSKSTYSPVDVLDDTTNPNLLDDTHRTIVADPVTNSAPVTITLPASPSVGQWYEIVDANGGASTDNITINPNGNFINGSNSNIVIDSDYDSIILVCIDSANWSIVAWRFPASGSTVTQLNDLSDATISGPVEGEILRYDTPANQWINDGNITIDDSGVLHINLSATGGLSLGDDAGVGNEFTISWFSDTTARFTGRTIQNGTSNNSITFLENGVVPAGDTYEVGLPEDNTLLCRTAAGDLYLRLPSKLNPSPPISGDILTAKDTEGQAAVNVLAFIAEGVRRRDLPELTLNSPTGTIASAISTITPGGLGQDEVQNFQVTGSGTYEIDFDGEVTAATLTETSDAATVEAAINSLSPHPNYGYFSVSVTGPTATAGLTVTFDGGTLIDGEALYVFSTAWASTTVINGSDITTDDWFVV